MGGTGAPAAAKEVTPEDIGITRLVAMKPDRDPGAKRAQALRGELRQKAVQYLRQAALKRQRVRTHDAAQLVSQATRSSIDGWSRPAMAFTGPGVE